MYWQGTEQSSLSFDLQLLWEILPPNWGEGEGKIKKKQYLLFLVNKVNGTQMCHMPVQITRTVKTMLKFTCFLLEMLSVYYKILNNNI